jgi:excisionase family DNA binding protein
MDEPLYTVRDVAERLQVTGRTIRDWIKSGRLKAVRAGHAWRIKASDLDAFLRQGREIPPLDPEA